MTVVNGKPVRHPMVPDQTGAQARAEQGRVGEERWGAGRDEPEQPGAQGGSVKKAQRIIHLSRTPPSTVWSRSGNKGKGVQDGLVEARANSSTVAI
ncbi:hypothetical protein PCANC_06677 [Puccinia coronata f. sp. avenae]|uniref:Uncharacterized protein n=1 Tax=Puccinia coronata f. sp. avenae TaxID=200324 RepID=A0A2N5VUA3_9BASI|nr:hypothetical protein PCASD_22638 [Puccinia coronata f. sp. avenae]PLW53556.1 hypothetical protein PCANC_06677 [Puccinia coronata f. sp. avenae]